MDNSTQLNADVLRKAFFGLSCYGFASNQEKSYFFLYFHRTDVLRDIKEFYKPSKPEIVRVAQQAADDRKRRVAYRQKQNQFVTHSTEAVFVEINNLLFLMEKAKRQEGTPSVFFNLG